MVPRGRADFKRAREALLESEERFQSAFEHAAIGMTLVGPDGKFLKVNRALCEMLGYEAPELLAKTFQDITHPEDLEADLDRVRRMLAGEIRTYQMEKRYFRKDGRIVHVLLSVSLHRNSAGKPLYFISQIQDIHSRKEAEKATADEHERLMAILCGIGDAVIATDRDRRVIFLNPVAETLTGWRQEEAVGRSFSEVFHVVGEKTDDACESLLEQAFATGKIIVRTDPVVLVTREGARRLIEDNAAPIADREGKTLGGILVFRDVTERRRMQEEMSRANRLESLGLLAGGIAHDFNNILTVILGNTSLALMTPALDLRFRKLIEESERACFRAKELTDQLLTFSKGGAPVRKAASLPELIRESVKFALRGSSVRFREDFPSDLWAAEVDAAQIGRVFNNLALNSVQAMPRGGEITVRGQNIACEGEGLPPAKPKRWVEILFCDGGSGIPKEHLQLIFDPFFSTKSQGSGLGLAICHSVMRRHGGRLFAESEPGRGTTMHLLFPAAEKAPLAQPPAPAAPVALKGRILVMDDEEAVRSAAREMLLALGCEVNCAEDGTRAVALYREAFARGTPFRAVLMDLTVPGGMGGREAAREMLAVDPDVQIIATSGYTTDPVMVEPRRHGFRAVLVKPYTVAELARVCMSVFNA